LGMETNRSIFGEKANRIFSFDKSIRFVVLLTSDGKVMAEFRRPGVVSLEPQSEAETVYMKATIAINMSTPMDRYHGRIRTAILAKEKVTIIVFNLMARIMMISADPDFQLQKVEELGRLIDELNLG
jgi:hypothetical protein